MERAVVDLIVDFERRFAKAQATEVRELEWGFVLLNSDFPFSQNHNRSVVTTPASADVVMADTEQIFAEAGLGHRFVSVGDDELGHTMSGDFVSAGFSHERLVSMVWPGWTASPPSDQPVDPVRQVAVQDLRAAMIRDWRCDLPDAAEHELAQLADRTTLNAKGAEVAHLAVCEGDEVAARGELFIDRETNISQFESLYTDPRFRGRGFAGSLVREALRISQLRGCPFTFLEADLDDWPRQWYRKLGYVERRRTHHFVRG